MYITFRQCFVDKYFVFINRFLVINSYFFMFTPSTFNEVSAISSTRDLYEFRNRHVWRWLRYTLFRSLSASGALFARHVWAISITVLSFENTRPTGNNPRVTLQFTKTENRPQLQRDNSRCGHNENYRRSAKHFENTIAKLKIIR